MLGCMRTTIRIKDHLLKRAKKRAADEGRTLTSLIEEALEIVVMEPRAAKQRKRIRLPISRSSGGVHAGVDLNRAADLEEVMNWP
jgi:hypothetical protein